MKQTLLRSQRGFTLTELIIYIGVLGVVAGVLTGILSTITTTQVEESAKNEVSGQLNFVSQTIQRLIRQSSVVDIASGTPTSTLVLRMASSTDDPTTIYSSGTAIYVQQGEGEAQTLTSANVVVDFLEFKKFSQYPAKDVVQIDIAISGAQEVTGQKISRSLRSAVSRVSAATFDDNLLPGSDNQYSIGVNSGNRWQSARFSEGVAIGGTSYRDATLPSGGAIIEGNVGIGITNPSYKLHVNGTLFVSATSTIGGAFYASSSSILLGNTSVGTTTSSGIFTVAPSTSGNPSLVVSSAGNVGVGTSTPSSLFTIATTTDILTISSAGAITLGGATPLYRVSNVAEPTGDNDVATKAYVDAAGGGSTMKVATSTSSAGAVSFDCGSGYVILYCGKGSNNSAATAQRMAVEALQGIGAYSATYLEACGFNEIGQQAIASWSGGGSTDAIAAICISQ